RPAPDPAPGSLRRVAGPGAGRAGRNGAGGGLGPPPVGDRRRAPERPGAGAPAAPTNGDPGARPAPGGRLAAAHRSLPGSQAEGDGVSGELRMPSVRFRQEREASWRELEGLVDRVQRLGLRSLSAEELGRLPVLYRAALSSLSVARAIALDAALLAYLNALAARAHVVLHGGREPFAPAFRRFWAQTFPRAVRSLRWHMRVAILLTALG